MAQPILTAVFGFFFGYLSSYLIYLFNLKNLELTDRVNDIYKDLEKVAEKATQYWLTTALSDDIPLLEAQIIGLQHRVVGMIEQLSETWWSMLPQMEQDLEFLTDSLTGGNFQVKGREVDLSRALACQIASSNVMNGIRKIRRNYIKIL